MASLQIGDEIGDEGQGFVLGLQVGGVSGAADHAWGDRDLDPGGEDAELFVGAVGVVGALQRQDGNGDGGQEGGQVERAETRVAPGVVPAVEGGVGFAVVAGEALAEVGGFVVGLDLADAGDDAAWAVVL